MDGSIPDQKALLNTWFAWFKPGYLQYLILALSLFYAFYGLGYRELVAWDESWYGVNAMEMQRSGDPLNYYYGGEMDDWNSKPPLSIWLINLSHKLFGYNEFALRFPSALASVVFFLIVYRMIRRYRDDLTAFFSCLILMGGTGIYGVHIARTGDTDMVFILFLTAATAFVTLYDRHEDRRAPLWVGVMLALAFLTKAMASLLYMPAILLFLLLRKKLVPLLRNPWFYAGAATYLLTICAWVAIMLNWGNTFSDNAQGGANAIENMFFYDTYSRLAVADFAKVNPYKFDFVLTVLDSKLNLWNYLFYAVSAGGLFLGVRMGWRSLLTFLRKPENGFLLLSILILSSTFLFLTFARNKNGWYLSPMLPYVAFVTATGLLTIAKKLPWTGFIFGALCLYTLGRTVNDQWRENPGVREFISESAGFLDAQEELYVTIPWIQPNELLYAQWHTRRIHRVFLIENIPQYSGKAIFGTFEPEFDPSWVDIRHSNEKYYIGKIR